MSAGEHPIDVSVVHPFDPWSLGIGGFDTFLDGFLRHAPADWRIEVIGVTRDPTAPLGRRTVADFHGRRLELRPVLFDPEPDRRRLPLSLRFACAARMRRIRPRGAIVQAHRFESLFATRCPAAARSVCFLHNHPPELVGAHSDRRWRRVGPLFELCLDRALKRADAVWGVDPRTPSWAEQRFTHLEGRAFAQRVWADPEVFRPGDADERRRDRVALRRRLGVKPETEIALLAGRLESQKAPVVLVEALGEIADAEPGLELLFVGHGRLERAIERRAAELGLARRVHRLDSMSREKLAAVLRGVDLTVCCSAYESGPRSVFESLACGCPAVCFDVGQAADALAPLADLGLLVEGRGAAPLGRAIRGALALGRDKRVSSRCVEAVAAAVPGEALRPVYDRYSSWLEADRAVVRRPSSK